MMKKGKVRKSTAKKNKQKEKVMLKFLDGKKTYIVAIITGVIAALNYLGIVVPQWVLELLAALGLTALRAAVK
jgi:hypothetical protein